MAAAAQQLRDRITFDMNQPIEITLDRDGNPTESTARDGSPEYRYFLNGHRIMWVPEAVHEAIQRANGGDMASFAITKHRSPKPWTVIHLDAQEPGYGYSNEAAPPQAPPIPQQPAARPTPTPAPQDAADSSPMYTALCAAIRTAAAAEKFAASIGRPLAFETSDVRAIAATLYIHSTGGGR